MHGQIYYLVIRSEHLHNPNLFKLIFVSLSQLTTPCALCVSYRRSSPSSLLLPSPVSCFSFIFYCFRVDCRCSSVCFVVRLCFRWPVFDGLLWHATCIPTAIHFIHLRWLWTVEMKIICVSLWFGSSFPNGCYLHSNRRELHYIALLLYGLFGVFIFFAATFTVFSRDGSVDSNVCTWRWCCHLFVCFVRSLSASFSRCWSQTHKLKPQCDSSLQFTNILNWKLFLFHELGEFNVQCSNETDTQQYSWMLVCCRAFHLERTQ